MTAKALSVILFCWIVICLLFPTFVQGQANTNEAAQLEAMLQEKMTRIEKWERTATAILVLSIVVVVLGIVAGVLQKFQNNWCRLATVVVGVSMSAITVVNNTAFPTDHRTLRKRALEARGVVTDLKLRILRGIPQDEPNRSAWYEEYGTRLRQLLEMEKEKTQAALDVRFFPPVYAQPTDAQKPAWLYKPPADSDNFYFLGVGDNPSLEKAKDLSRKDATGRAVDYFTAQFKSSQQGKGAAVDLEALSHHIVKSAEEAETYFEYEPGAHAYRYYLLLRVHRDVAETYLRLYSLQRKASVSPELNTAVQSARQSAAPVSSRPFPYVLGEYKVAQRHIKRLAWLQGTIAIYVGDVHRAAPAQVVIFRVSPATAINETGKIDYARLRRRLRSEDVLLDRRVADKERVPLTLEKQECLFEFRYAWPAAGEDYAVLKLSRK